MRRTPHVRPIITANAITKPSSGESTSGRMTFSPSADHLKAPTPACATTAPARPPTSACDELDGMPYHHVIRFQVIAPSKAASTTVCTTMAGSANPDAIVLATAVPVIAPMKLNSPAMSTAVRTGKTPVETTVAIAFAASWNPLMKSKTMAVTMTTMRRLTMLDREVGERIGHVLATVDRLLQVFEDLLLAKQYLRVDLFVAE